MKSCSLDDNVTQFAKEIKLLSVMKHKNIIEFIGILILNTEQKLYLVTELMDTDLSKVMKQLNFSQKLRVAKNIAKGMYGCK